MTQVPDELRMEIKGLMIDPSSNVPIVILRDTASDIFLPIWIGFFEANSIALQVEGVDSPRPLTHDLVLAMLRRLGATVEKVVINDLRDSTFYAELSVSQGDRSYTIDSRPSDAIAIALRAEAPIFVMRQVLERAQAVNRDTEASEEERIRKILEELSPEDLGKYTM